MKKLEEIMIPSMLVGLTLTSVMLAGVTNYVKRIDHVSGPEAAGLLSLVAAPTILGSAPMVYCALKEVYKDLRSYFN